MGKKLLKFSSGAAMVLGLTMVTASVAEASRCSEIIRGLVVCQVCGTLGCCDTVFIDNQLVQVTCT